MIISICSVLFDYAGDYLVDAVVDDSEFSHIARRVSRTATLDGGSVIVDNGYTAGDATFLIVLRDIDSATRLGLMALVQRHSALTVAVKDNIFSGVVEKLDDKDTMKIRFLVNEQLNEA
jgi:hypothetical protein